MRFERGEAGPFGWVVHPRGRKPGQIRDDIRTLVRWSADRWGSYFPRERGYAVTVNLAESDEAESLAAQPLRLCADRGDFHAEVTVEVPDVGHVRMYGRATSSHMLVAELQARRYVKIGRALGALAGFGVFGTLAWFSVGVVDPIFVLGGLLMVVALVVSLTAGAALGSWFGDRFADRARRRAAQMVEADPGIEADLRRWKSLVRQLVAQRTVLRGGDRQQPFRREAEAVG